MERETQFITTPNGRNVELKTYITGREKRAIESVYYQDVEMTATGGEQTIKGFKGSVINEAQNRAIETVVVAIDQSPDNILNRVLDMPLEDYEAVLAAIEAVTTDKKKGVNTSER
jgi:predicted ATP-grasp superfamily ATP-dependent carboligase